MLRRAGLLDHRRSGADLQRRVRARVRARRRRHVSARPRADRQPRRRSSSPALYYAFGPFRMSQIAHVQMVATGWIPIALWRTASLFLDTALALAGVFAGGWILQTLSNTVRRLFHGAARARDRRATGGVWCAAIGGRARSASWRRRASSSAARSRRSARRTTVRARAITVARRRARSSPTAPTSVSYVVGKNSVGVWRWLPTAVGIDPEKELFPGLFALVLRRDRDCRRGRRSAVGVGGSCCIRGRGDRRRLCRWGRASAVWGASSPARTVQLAARDRAGDGRHARAGAIRDCRHRGCCRSLLASADARARARRASWRRIVIACAVAAVVADGWAVPIARCAYSARGRPEDRAVASWLRAGAPGAVLHLPAPPARRPDARLSVHDAGARSSDRQRLQRLCHAAARVLRRVLLPLSDFEDFRRRSGCFARRRPLRIVHPDDYTRATNAERSPSAPRRVPRLRSDREAKRGCRGRRRSS